MKKKSVHDETWTLAEIRKAYVVSQKIDWTDEWARVFVAHLMAIRNDREASCKKTPNK